MRWWPSSVVWGILFKAIISCTDIYSASMNSGVWPHCQVPWPALFFLSFREEYRVVSRPYSVSLFPHCFTTVSIAAEEPSVEHARDVLHTSPALGWFWPVRASLSRSVSCPRNVPFVSSFSRLSCSRDVSNGTKQGDADASAECRLFYCACSRRKVCYFFTEWTAPRLLLCYNFIEWTAPILFLIDECGRTTAKTQDMAVQSVQSRHSVFSSPSILLRVSVCSYATSSSDAGMSNRVDRVDICDLPPHLAHLSIGVECTAVYWKVKRIEYISQTLTLLKYHSIPPMHQGLTLAQRVN